MDKSLRERERGTSFAFARGRGQGSGKFAQTFTAESPSSPEMIDIFFTNEGTELGALFSSQIVDTITHTLHI